MHPTHGLATTLKLKVSVLLASWPVKALPPFLVYCQAPTNHCMPANNVQTPSTISINQSHVTSLHFILSPHVQLLIRVVWGDMASLTSYLQGYLGSIRARATSQEIPQADVCLNSSQSGCRYSCKYK